MDREVKSLNLTVSRRFEAPVEQVWRAWLEPERVKQWWGPEGFTAPIARMDFREGGTSFICMRSPEFGEFYNTWSYRRIVPMHEIEFIQEFTDAAGRKLEPVAIGLPPGIPSEVRHVVSFNSAADNATDLSVTEYGYTSEHVVEVSRMGMEQCLEKMAASLE